MGRKETAWTPEGALGLSVASVPEQVHCPSGPWFLFRTFSIKVLKNELKQKEKKTKPYQPEKSASG